MTKRKFLGEFEQIVLLAVARMRGEGYGMAIRREIEDRTTRGVSIGAIYATLERLEGKGYVISHAGEATAERGGRARRYFAVTPTGADGLLQSRDMLDSMWDGVELDGNAGGQGQEVA
jgi:DNA-binding PadR family transcriptional regulator